MQKISSFLVKFRIFILVATLLVTLVCLWLIPHVTVNYDMSRYLPEDSAVRQGTLIMKDEFPTTDTIHLMFEGLVQAEQAEIYDELNNIPNISHIETQTLDGYSLFIITIDVDIFSPEGSEIVETLNDRYRAHDMTLSSAASMPLNILTLTIPAVAIMLVILFVLCRSWFEPIIFLVNIGAAIALNMGTNIIFDSVSDITISIAAILQLVLSMDYAIIFLNRYRREKQLTDDKFTAMKSTIRNCFATVTSIGVTTIVGMIMLVFMSFTIGRDLGLVIAKGVFFSLICVFTVMPAIVLMFDRVIEKTKKPTIPLKMSKIAAFCYRGRWAMLIFFVAIFAATFFIRGNINITYSQASYDRVHQVFELDNPIVVLYDNTDEEHIATLAEEWANTDGVIEIESYALTLAQTLTALEIAHITEMPQPMVEQILQLYAMTHGSLPPTEITLYDFLSFLSEQNPQDETLSAMLGEMESGRSMLVGESFSRLIISTSMPIENTATFEFIEQLTRDMESNLSSEFFIIGESAIAHEMNKGFRDELNLITILTVIAFFIVAALSFRSFPISAILVCVIQSSVFITMAAAHLFGDGIMFLALIIAQVLLKSRIIDYGVLYTANYVESRKTDDVKSATKNALNNSIHTIVTSGLIIIIITFVLGLIFIDLNIAISEILLLVSQGCAIGVILTIFILPSLMAVFDGAIHRARRKAK